MCPLKPGNRQGLPWKGANSHKAVMLWEMRGRLVFLASLSALAERLFCFLIEILIHD